MPDIGPQSANSLAIEKITITADRGFVNSADTIEIQLMTDELAIYEHIDLPYLTAKMTLSDTRDLNTKINFQGTERVEVTLSIPGNEAKRVTKNFMITHIENITPTNDTSETMILSMIEEHFYYSEANAISRAFAGKPEEIIEEILQNDLQLQVERRLTGPSRQSPIRVVIPYWSPLNTARWLRNRATTEYGMPFYLYSSLNSENLIMTDLEYLIGEQNQPMNNGREYLYGQAFTQSADAASVIDQSFIIEKYQIARANDGFRMLTEGAVNSRYNFINTLTNQSLIADNIRETDKTAMEDLVTRNVISPALGKIYDPDLEFNDRSIYDYTASSITQIVTSNSFEDNYLNYYEEENPYDYRITHVRPQIYRKYMTKTPISFVAPGYNFLGPDAGSVGSKINLLILKNDQDIYEGGSIDAATDGKRSGAHIIYSMRHVLSANDYRVSITAGRLNEGEGLFSAPERGIG